MPIQRQPLALIAAHRILGQLATDDGRLDEAADHLAASLELARACIAPFEQAQSLLALAELAARSGQHNEAQRLIGEVRAICEPMEAQRLLALTDDLDARLQAMADPRPAGLTAREIDVLRLVSQGLTNAAVADQLYISQRTVTSHLTSIYTKIGVNNRAEATRYAIESDII